MTTALLAAVAWAGSAIGRRARELSCSASTVAPASLIALAYHKPCGLVCTHSDELGRRTVYDAVLEALPEEFTIGCKWHACGRLDQDTSGLLIMTTDGRLVQHVTDPTVGGHAVVKHYRAKCHLLPEGAVERLREGVDLGGGLGVSAPAEVEIESQERKSQVLSMRISEGKNRQIRRSIHAVGSGVMALHRLAVGGVELGDLAEGEWRWLSEEELRVGLQYDAPPQETAKAAAAAPHTRADPQGTSTARVEAEAASTPAMTTAVEASTVVGSEAADASYALLDCGNLRRLERFGDRLIQRPCPAATWPRGLPSHRWEACELAYVEAAQAGGTAQETGHWEGTALEEVLAQQKEQEQAQEKQAQAQQDGGGGGGGGGAGVAEDVAAAATAVAPWAMAADAGFSLLLHAGPSGQVGAFPEQADNWRWLRAACERGAAANGRPLRVLNLFAHTGGSTLACAAGGAHVVHLDGARSAVARARANADASGLGAAPIRWISDDVLTYVSRAVRRGEAFDGVVLDPPAFGRGGKKGEWRIQRDLPKLAGMLAELLDAEAAGSFVLLTCHDARWPGSKLAEVVTQIAAPGGGGGGGGGRGGRGGSPRRSAPRVEVSEMVLRAVEAEGKDLPLGCFARWQREA